MFFVLFACLEIMIRLLKTLRIGAEIFLAFSTSHSVFAHTFSSFSCNWFIVSILLIHIYSSLHHLHVCATLASYKIWIFFHKICQHYLVIFFSLLSEIAVKFIFSYCFPAIIFRTCNIQGFFCKLKQVS